MGSSTNQELQAYYEHLRTPSEILIKEQHQRSVLTKLLTVSSNLHYYIQKQVHLLNLLLQSMYVLCLFWSLNKGSTVLFLFIFISFNLMHCHLIS